MASWNRFYTILLMYAIAEFIWKFRKLFYRGKFFSNRTRWNKKFEIFFFLLFAFKKSSSSLFFFFLLFPMKKVKKLKRKLQFCFRVIKAGTQNRPDWIRELRNWKNKSNNQSLWWAWKQQTPFVGDYAVEAIDHTKDKNKAPFPDFLKHPVYACIFRICCILEVLTLVYTCLWKPI